MSKTTRTTTYSPIPYWDKKVNYLNTQAQWLSKSYLSNYWQNRLQKAIKKNKINTQQEIDDFINQRKIEASDISFATFNQTLQQYAYHLLQPFQVYEKSLKPTAVKTAYLASISKIGQTLGAKGVSSIAAGAGFGAGLLLLKHLQAKLNQQAYYIQAAQNPQALVENLMFQTAKGAVLKQGLGAGKRIGQLAAYTIAPGLFDNRVRIPHPLDPDTEVLSPIFKPTRWFHKFHAGVFDNLADKISQRRIKKGKPANNVITYALKKEANKYRKNKRRSIWWWLFYPLGSWFLSILGELGFGLLYKFSPFLNTIVRGYLGQIAKAGVSLRSFGYGTVANIAASRLGIPNPGFEIPLGATGFKLPITAAGTLGYLGGMYHQAVVNLANNYSSVSLDIFSNKAASSVLMRQNMMPVEYKSIYGSNYYNHLGAQNQYLRDFGRPNYLTGTYKGLGTEQWDLMNAKWTGKDFLGLGKLSRWYFKHPFLGGSISGFTDGIMIGTALGLPWHYRLALASGMAIMGGLSTSPLMRNLKTYSLIGAGLGAEIALLTGNNPWIFGGIGFGVGVGANLFTNLGNMVNLNTSGLTPGWYTYQQLGMTSNPIPGASKFYIKDFYFYQGESAFNSANWPEIIQGLQGQRASFAKNKLLTRLAKWGSKLSPSARMRVASILKKLRYLRYTKGAFWGAGIGLQLSLLIPWLPWYGGLIGGAALGVLAQLGWEYILTRLAAKVSDVLTLFTTGLGQVINFVSNVFIGAQYGSSLYHWVQNIKHSIATRSLSPIKAGFSKFILPASVFSISVLTALIIGGTAGAIILLALGIGLAAEAVFKFTYIFGLQSKYPSFVSFLNEKLFKPAFNAVAEGSSAIASAMFGILSGFLVAIFSRNWQELIQGIVMAGVSIAQVLGAAASFLLPILIASGTIIPSQQVSTIIGLNSFRSQKGFLSKSADLTQFNYDLTYTYKGDLIDTDGKEIETAYFEIVDTYQGDLLTHHVNEQDSEYKIVEDNKIIGFGSYGLDNKPPTKNLNNLELNAGQTKTISHKLILNDNLNKILSGDQVMCDQFRIIYEGPNTINKIKGQVVSSSNSICLDKNGNLVAPPAAMFAQELAIFLDEEYTQEINNIPAGCSWADCPQKPSCCVKKHINYVTIYDFKQNVCQKNQEENLSCPSVDPSLSRLQARMGYQIKQIALNIIKSSTVQYNYLQCVGFVQAVEAQYGRTLPSTSKGPNDSGTACRYSQQCVANYHFYEPGEIEPQPTDILILGPPSCQRNGQENAGHMAYIVDKRGVNIFTAEASGYTGRTLDRGVYKTNNNSIRGYLRYEPGWSCNQN